MKRIYLFIAVMPFMAMHCKKDDVQPNPTPTTPKATSYVADANFGAQIIGANKIHQKIFQGWLSPGTKTNFRVIRIFFTYELGGGATLSNIKNVSIAIKDSAGISDPFPELTVAPTITNSTGSYTWPTPVGLMSNKTYIPVVWADFVNAPMGGTLVLKSRIEYQWDSSGIGTTATVSGPEIKVVNPTLSISGASDMPAPGYIVAGVADTVASYDVTAVGDTAYVPELKITSANISLYQSFSAMINGVQVGSVSGNFTDTARLPLGHTFQAGATRVYVMGTLKPITSDQQSGLNMMVSVSNTVYYTSPGQVKVFANTRSGSTMYSTKGIIGLTFFEVPSTVIDTTNAQLIGWWKVVGGVWKQITLKPSFGDVGNNNNLAYKNFKFYEGPSSAMIDRTNMVKFFDANGAEDTSITESDTDFTIMWLNDDDATPNGKEYRLYARSNGFTNPNAPGNGSDGFTLSYAGDDTGGMDFKNLAPVAGSLMAALTNGSSTQRFNFLWSDKSAGAAYSANPEFRRGGWKHGRFVSSSFSQSFHQRH